MNRIVPLGLIALATFASTARCAAAPATATTSPALRDLIAAARGAPAPLCEQAARGLQFGWSSADAPRTPLDHRSARLRRRSLGEADVRFLLHSLDTPDPCVRELAVRLLAAVEREEVASGLIERLDDADSTLRLTAALGLGLAAGRPLRAVEPLTRAARDVAVGVRANAVWALGRIRDPRGAAPARGRLGDASPLVREAAAGALGHLGVESAVPDLERALRADAVPGVRRTAAWAVVQIGGEGAAGRVATALAADDDPAVREMCAWGLGQLPGRTPLEPLLEAAGRDDDEAVREAAVWALGQRSVAAAAGVLGERVGSDRSLAVRRTAAWALGQVGVRSAPAGLVEALGDDDDELRLTAAWALSEIRDERTLPALRSALARERHERARKAILRALIHAGEPAERLAELLRSADPEVRRSTIRAVAGRGGPDPWPWPQPRPRPFP